ncbi:hypothetical protein [Stutzerimonas balearica]|uniref:Uncharacterized protein n=3 Tax=Stutzerimonas TaxID=2901164 RepID=A0A8D3XYF5_9GAMM|nr:hypothetical protein [Stutzerimonas balearica]MBB59569.1 hypothetical protein [Pseudomonas sp.]WIX03303.1 hypothetical protein QK899_02365 [Pseudomonas sp. AR5]AJE13918.1 hypothetical protein CL52_02210 [Stutzerimonas balearica DSM 6083]MBC7198678.1 hypothetical protein [Stutzerimonas balearica]MBD3735256.1 hypothetical protein [Stutzerimonas balearica]
MRHRIGIWLLVLLLGWLPALAESATEQELSTLQTLQIHASRATSSLLLYRGEGFQKAHLARMERDIQALDTALQALPSVSSPLRESHRALEAKLREGAAFGFKEDDMPWGWPLELSKALRDFLTAARAQQGPGVHAELPAKVEYLAVQYLSRAYIGSFETAREQPDTYLGQDERQLVPAIDAEFATLQGQESKLASLKTRWDFLKVALEDMNSASNNFSTASGRPFAPITVDRHTRSLSDQWMALGQ